MFTTGVYRSWKMIQEEKYSAMRSMLPEFRGLVLDIGIGSGYFEKFFSGRLKACRIICIDNDMAMLRQCSGLCVLADGNALPFRESAFDGVVCLDTIHLIKKNDYKRVLNKNGFFLVSLFFNMENFEERVKFLKKKLSGFRIINEKISHGQENEIIFLALRCGHF